MRLLNVLSYPPPSPPPPLTPFSPQPNLQAQAVQADFSPKLILFGQTSVACSVFYISFKSPCYLISDVLGCSFEFAVLLPLSSALQREYGEQLVACGMVGAAMEVFEKQELWDNLLICYRLLDKIPQALALVKARLEVPPPPPSLLPSSRCSLDWNGRVVCVRDRWGGEILQYSV